MPSEAQALLETSSTPDTHFWKTIREEFSDPHVHLPALLNLIRDFLWTYLSYNLLNDQLTKTDDTNFDAQGQWLGQQLYSTLAMLGTLIGTWGFYKLRKLKDEEGNAREFLWDHGLIYVMAAAVAIYTWDRAQVLAIQAFKNKGYTDETAGYLAAFATGTEGCVQFSSIVLLRTLCIKDYRDFFLENPKKFATLFMPRLFCSLTLVAAPGASWQLVYNAGTLYAWGAFLTSMAVALTVAFFNYTSVKLSITLLKKCEGDVAQIEPDITSDTTSITIDEPPTLQNTLKLEDLETIPGAQTESDGSDSSSESPKNVPARKSSLKKEGVDYFLPRSSRNLLAKKLTSSTLPTLFLADTENPSGPDLQTPLVLETTLAGC